MNRKVKQALGSLTELLRDAGPAAVAVSGGVDSMTLSVIAHQTLNSNVQMFHAVSPAVPPDATARVCRYAEQQGWRLRMVDAAELNDPNYINNPLNRCYFCKSNLYQTIAHASDAVIFSGTNLDDLGEFRPGLEAARNYGVRHPFVEVSIDKQTVRDIARKLSLFDLAELPASPCLSSRIETGIPIAPDTLGLINKVENYVRQDMHLNGETVRCRVRKGRVVIELDPATLATLTADQQWLMSRVIVRMLRAEGSDDPVEFAPYRRASAFLRQPQNGET